MRKYVFISIALLVVITSGAFLYLKNKHAPDIDTIDPYTYENQFGSSTVATGTSVGIGGQSVTGGAVGARSLPFDLEKIKSMSSMYGEGNYEVVQNEEYDITFIEQDLQFFIGLHKAPVGWARKLAEDKLIEVLQLPKEDICKLNVFVGTQAALDPNGPYGYGLSFCPGSVSLPALDPNAQ